MSTVAQPSARGRKVPELMPPVRPSETVCALCEAPAGEVTLVKLTLAEKKARGLTEFDGNYVCAGSCAKQRNRAMVRLLRVAARSRRS